MEEPPIVTKKELNLSYIAGLFDGEGCISIHSSKNSFTVYVGIEMRDSLALKKIQSIFGGKIGVVHNKKKNCTMRRIRFSSRLAAKFLRSVYPFLTVKKKQAKVALDMLDYRKTTKHTFQDRVARYEQWADKCKSLKKEDWIEL